MTLNIGTRLTMRAVVRDARELANMERHAIHYFERLLAHHFPLTPFHELEPGPSGWEFWRNTRARHRAGQ